MAPHAGQMQSRVVRVVPLLRLRHLGDRRFDYLVPGRLADRVRVGSVVSVPFGRRTVRAVVVEPVACGEREEQELREVEAVAEDSVSEELVRLAGELAERYLSSYEACLRLVAPPAASPGSPRRARQTWAVRIACQATGREASSRPEPPSIPEPSPGGEASLPEQTSQPSVILTQKQRSLLNAIPESGGDASEACRRAGVGVGVLHALVGKGLVALSEPPVDTSEHGVGGGSGAGLSGVDAPALWPEQAAVAAGLVHAYETPGLAKRVLWGVTGSGKTEIYLRLVERVLQDAAAAVLLVPEIALTPQMIQRVRARFGDKVGVLHSALTPSQRRKEYRRIATGEAPVVVGARSAVFAPVPGLRLVVIDESHDDSYKQEEEPRYHAHTVAELRLSEKGGLLLEGSATPSVEVSLRSQDCLRLTRRAAGETPACETVDMRVQGSGQLLAARTREALADVLCRGEQAIVLLNRRGYAGHVHCESCGHVMMCAECEVSLTYHDRGRRLLCHHCGRSYAQPPLCPVCKGAALTRAAPGTERLDRELRRLVPNEQVFRLDSDILTSGTRIQAVLHAFASTKPAVLVGTQMVAKGHDFPQVTLVIVADADTGLYVPDFRAAERTFQLLTQVAGRAGRADKPGRVLVQTWNPDVPCIRMALEGDETGFYSQELAIRQRLGYPPFADLLRIVTVAEEATRAEASARHLVERLSPYFAPPELHGPARLPTLRGRCRWHLVLAVRNGERARRIVGQAMAQLREPYRRRGVTLLVDVDPVSFG